MLVRFSVENWMSFRNRSTLSMLATLERQHGDRVPLVQKYSARILPVAIIYGGNASGKSNLFKALYFVRNLVTRGVSLEGMIPVEPFLLDNDMRDQPTRFTVEILADEVIYELEFSVTKQMVLEEKLTRRMKTTDRVPYHRKHGQGIRFHASYHDNDALKYASAGTRDNQLFLTNSVSQKIDMFRPVYDWFKALTLIAPKSQFLHLAGVVSEGHPMYWAMSKVLPLLDTGISYLSGETVPMENLSFPDPMIAGLLEELKDGDLVRLTIGSELYQVARKGDELVAKKIYAYHRGSDGAEVKLDFGQESDGSQRVIHLLPAFLGASARGSTSVYAIDELDRSLHTLLTRHLIEAYLQSCSSDSRGQLLITTHDLLLMDQEIFRRDEMWITEREVSGASRLLAISEYEDVRYDKDIRKSYLQGRLGGIPRLLLGSLPQSKAGSNEGGESPY